MSGTDATPAGFLTGGGAVGALMRRHDWSQSPLGDPAGWPQSLRSVVGLLLGSKFPMFVAWGEELGFLYNDSYVEILGEKHPKALGSRFCDVWGEIWPDISPLIDAAMSGEATYRENLRLVMNRKGFDEQTYFTFSYSPVRDESGRVAGMFCACTETTPQVLNARREADERERLRLMFDQAPGMIAMLRGPDHVFEIANEKYLELVGRRDIIGRPLRLALPQIAEQGFLDLLDDVYRTGEPFLGWGVAVQVGQAPGGAVDERLVDFIYQPVKDEAGRISGIFVQANDVTSRREAEARLQELNETLEAQVAERTAERDRIWNLPRELMCVARLDGTLLSVNPAWERVLGWTVDWLTGRNAIEIRHPDDRERTAAELAKLAVGIPTHGYEDRYKHKNGGWRWISWTIEPENGLIYCVGRDITDEKEARAALEAAEAARREADALYRAYFANTGEALFVVRVLPDGDFSLEELNPAHEKLTGLRNADLHGKRIREQLPLTAIEPVARNYRRAVEAGRPIGYREMLDLPAGARHWDTVLVPVRDESGAITRLVGSGRDVTAQVQAEEALRQAQKMEAVGQLTGGIAHDFNNLLGAVVGSLDLIRRKPTDVERVKHYADAGLKAAERGAKLTGQLLAFSRAQRLEQKPVAVSDLVANMRDMLDRSLGPLVRLTFDLGSDGAALTDPTQLELAILNLAINARDAMPDGGELIIATASRVLPGDAEVRAGEYVEIAVADTGSGMPPDVAARAFDPFFTTKGVGKGTGLGLSQVYGVARQTGGTVRIESRAGAGATVRILLPKTDLPVQADDDAKIAGDDGARGVATILVIDDDPDVRRVLVDSLDALGYKVAEAADGATGLKMLERCAPDLMMVDFAMPGMNGAEVARAAREKRPKLPIIFATGYSDTAAIEGVAGRDAIVLRKPFRVDDLQAVLSEALASKTDAAAG